MTINTFYVQVLFAFSCCLAILLFIQEMLILKINLRSFNTKEIGEFLTINPEKVKMVSAQLLEKAKRKILIFFVCRSAINAEVFVANKITDTEVEKLSPKLRSLLEHTEYTMKLCAGDSF